MKQILLISILLFSGCDGPLQNDLLPSSWDLGVSVLTKGEGEEFGPELFPLTAGDEWLYYAPGKHMIQTVTEDTERTNGVTSTVILREDGGNIYKHYLRVTTSLVQDFGSQFNWWPVAIVRLHFPVKIGKKWSTGDRYANLHVDATAESIETIDTAMGAYRCVKVHYYIRDNANQTKMHQWMWFAPGVGIVRWKHSLGYGMYKAPTEADWLLRHFTITGYEEERQGARLR